MRIFAIKDEEQSQEIILGYLLYYEKAKAFYIELPENMDEWDAPLLLSSFVKRNQHTVNAYWSRLWVQQRIIPSDRQNLGQVLKANGLKTYDPFSLLLLAKGRCAQDSYYLEEIRITDLPASITARWQKKVEDIVPLADNHLLVFFRDGTVKKYNVSALVKEQSAFSAILNHTELFRAVQIQPDGYGVSWNDTLVISNEQLYQGGISIPLSLDDFHAFVSCRIVNTAEAQELLDCSRQYINELVKKGLLHPVREDAKNKLFFRNEIMQRKNGSSHL